MTIRQRLSRSNIMMILIPVVLMVIFINVVMWHSMQYLEDNGLFGNQQFERARTFLAERLGDRAMDMDDVFAIVKEAESGLSEKHSQAALYAGDDLLYPDGFTNHALARGIDLHAFNGETITVGEVSYYIQAAGAYTVVLSLDSRVPDGVAAFRTFFQKTGFLTFAFVLAGICLTNSVLTQIMFRHIMRPLETLANGVHELRDGNLGYRIGYKPCNEFRPVCDDFDEMAARLFDMVHEKQVDEERRKELIAGISHDLRTPLTAIKAYVEGIEKGVASTPALQARYIETIKSKAAMMESIINRLFQYAKLDMDDFPVVRRKVDAGMLAEEYVTHYAAEYAKRGLRLGFTGGAEGMFIQADVDLLNNVFVNVFDNSVRYKQAETGTLAVSCERDGDEVLLRLRDEGPGVPAESLPKLFDVFYRADAARNSEGSGLGLAISAKNIQRMGGRIEAANAAGGGLEITLRFPLAKEGEEA